MESQIVVLAYSRPLRRRLACEIEIEIYTGEREECSAESRHVSTSELSRTDQVQIKTVDHAIF
jgi:hypothetical protein